MIDQVSQCKRKTSSNAVSPIYLLAMCVCYALVLVGTAQAQLGPGIISAVAGTGAPGLSGDGGLATNAELNQPRGLALDSLGNIYIADTSNARIRMVTSTGYISTVAGTTGGFSGDGGLATSAQLNGPTDVALDSAGNLYIADYANNRLRVVNRTSSTITVAGVSIPAQCIETVAGTGIAQEGKDGPAISTSLWGPSGVAVDSAGNIYIADKGGNLVRAINVGTQPVTIATIPIPAGYIGTIAGPLSTMCSGHDAYGNNCPATEASLAVSEGVALDNNGNIYITDSSHYEIREVNAQTGYITDVAGDGTGGPSGDGGLATNAELSDPAQVAIDQSGDIFIADKSNNVIREVTASTDYISTFAGTNGTEGFEGNGGPATSAELDSPNGVAMDLSGNVYIADTDNNQVRAVGAVACTGLNLVSIYPTSLYPGDTVTLRGCGFGTAQGGNGEVQFSPGGFNASIVSWSNTIIVATVPSASFQPGTINVRQNSVWSNGIAFTVPLPQITSYTPNPLVLYPGTTVTLYGNYFGNAQGNGEVQFSPSGVNGTIDTWSNSTPTGDSITFTVPATSFQPGSINVQQYAQWSTGVGYTVGSPNPTSFSPSSGPVGTTVSISGTNIGTGQCATVTFNGAAANTTVVNGILQATVPTGATTGPINVIIGGLSTTVPGGSFTVN